MLARITRDAQTLHSALIDLLFPPRCVNCKRVGSWFCPLCQSSIEFIRAPYCRQCGRPDLESPCHLCRQFPLTIDGMRAVAYFEGALRQAIHAFKYQRRVDLAPLWGEMLAVYARAESISYDVIIPIPLHRERERARGYNQAALLARALAAPRTAIIWEDALTRTRATRPQMELDAAERRANVRDAFAASARVRAHRVLLIDDVCTTGATMEACSVALKNQGAQSVWGLALARGR